MSNNAHDTGCAGSWGDRQQPGAGRSVGVCWNCGYGVIGSQRTDGIGTATGATASVVAAFAYARGNGGTSQLQRGSTSSQATATSAGARDCRRQSGLQYRVSE